jgi:hypothetical protein
MRNLRLRIVILEVGTLEIKKPSIGLGSGKKQVNLDHGL